MSLQARKKVLESLLFFNDSLESISSQLANFEWDYEEELVVLKPSHLTQVLKRHLTRELDASAVEEWADLVEGRDDIGIDPDHEELIKELLFELANPSLTRVLTVESATQWLERFQRS